MKEGRIKGFPVDGGGSSAVTLTGSNIVIHYRLVFAETIIAMQISVGTPMYTTTYNLFFFVTGTATRRAPNDRLTVAFDDHVEPHSVIGDTEVERSQEVLSPRVATAGQSLGPLHVCLTLEEPLDILQEDELRAVSHLL